MKVRIGIGAAVGSSGAVGPGTGVGPGSRAGAAPDWVSRLGSVAGSVVALGFDSLWLPEILSGMPVDPVVALAWVGSKFPDLKLGTTMLLPGRHPLRLAKQVATLDALSGGRLLVTFVPGLAIGPEREVVGVEPPRRGAAMEELLPVLRRLWAGEAVTFDGPAGTAEVVLSPRPVQDPFECWMGGTARASLERCGKLADGWLPAMCTPAEAAAGRRVVEDAAGMAGRRISPEHFGVSIGYGRTALSEQMTARLRERSHGRPVHELVPVGLGAVRDLLLRFIDAGFSKFVLRPVETPEDWARELEDLASAVGDLQT